MKKIWNASRICVSSLRRGHANLLCIVPILVYVLPKQVHQTAPGHSYLYTCKGGTRTKGVCRFLTLPTSPSTWKRPNSTHGRTYKSQKRTLLKINECSRGQPQYPEKWGWKTWNNKVYSTWYSQAVTHPSTNQARRCLTSVIGREPVCSTWYGRRHGVGPFGGPKCCPSN